MRKCISSGSLCSLYSTRGKSRGVLQLSNCCMRTPDPYPIRCRFSHDSNAWCESRMQDAILMNFVFAWRQSILTRPSPTGKRMDGARWVAQQRAPLTSHHADSRASKAR